MPGIAIIGCQWGDEGKGKIVDFLSQDADIVARFNGGPNAGHTVLYQDKTLIFHQIPCGILNRRVLGIIGQGCLLDIQVLKEEINVLRELRLDFTGRLFIDPKVHLIFPYHRIIDRMREMKGRKIGTTGRGIGPAYEDKYSRIGIRAGELKSWDRFEKLLRKNIAQKNFYLMELYDAEPIKEKEAIIEFKREAPEIIPLLTDTARLIQESLLKGKKVIFEGAQGTLLDIDCGTYPYVTSSSTTAAGVATGLGISPKEITEIIGVAKAYTTRVGEGPFPTEIKEPIGERLRKKGKEFGATTGRPRRTGWLDLGIIRYARRINGFEKLILTKLDVLDDLAEILVADGYETKEGKVDDFDPEIVEQLKPRYRKLLGWQKSLGSLKRLSDMPKAARYYIEVIEERTGCEVIGVSVGEKREATIFKDGWM